MKKVIYVLALVAIMVSCKKETPNDFVTLQGTIQNYDGESLTIYGKKDFKTIFVDENGIFRDTLTVEDGFHGLKIGEKQSVIYLKNGYVLDIETDYEQYPTAITFKGKGKADNQYILDKMAFIKNENLESPNAVFELEKEAFDAKMNSLESDLEKLIVDAEDLDETLAAQEREANQKLLEFFNSNYQAQHTSSVRLKKGAPSPKFNYPNTEGENVSLDDLKGDYVYVDVWATWCGPCKKEIPHLKEIQKEYEGKNISFVSLSIDKQENKDKWLEMVKNEQLSGIQIMADKDFRSDFVTAYSINAIPRFILIDKEGNILDANAPRPSDPRLKELFSSLNL